MKLLSQKCQTIPDQLRIEEQTRELALPKWRAWLALLHITLLFVRDLHDTSGMDRVYLARRPASLYYSRIIKRDGPPSETSTVNPPCEGN